VQTTRKSKFDPTGCSLVKGQIKRLNCSQWFYIHQWKKLPSQSREPAGMTWVNCDN
jgi:hypothetical protein